MLANHMGETAIVALLGAGAGSFLTIRLALRRLASSLPRRTSGRG